ncbi:MAG: alpha-1,2-fucosyltransferase [Dysgonomonas sp.]
MIINYDLPGQLCNRIWSLIPSIAYGLEYKEKVMVINLDKYVGDFENLNSNSLIKFTSRKRIKRMLISLKARGYIQNGKSNILRKLFNLNFVEGWSNRLGNAEMVERQSDDIREIFTFKCDITNPVDKFFANQNEYSVVGVHIRRGDYKDWLKGIYYYTDDEYICILNSIEEQLKMEGKKVRFLLCSNEKVNLDNYKHLDCFIIPNASGSQDLYALSKCDYIIGPPSSYSQWASFLGKVPVKFIMYSNEKIDLSDFSKIISFNTFENRKNLNID